MQKILVLLPSWEWRFGRWGGIVQYRFRALWMWQWPKAMAIQHWWRCLLQDLSFTWGQGNVRKRATLGKVSTITGSAVQYRCVMTVTTECLRAILTVCNLLLSQWNKILKKAEVKNRKLTEKPKLYSTQDMRLPQLCCWGLRSSGMWHYVARLVLLDIPDTCSALSMKGQVGHTHNYPNWQVNCS